MNPAPTSLLRGALGVLLLAARLALAAPGDQPVPPVPASKLAERKDLIRSASLPAKGLFVGDQLSDGAKERLSELVVDALGLNIEVALIVPTGPWEIDGGRHTDNALTAARLNAVRRFLGERGVDTRRIFVESRIDTQAREPRLEVQMVGQPASD